MKARLWIGLLGAGVVPAGILVVALLIGRSPVEENQHEPSDQVQAVRELTKGESRILEIIQDMYGAQNTREDVLFANDEAVILVEAADGTTALMASLTNLAGWYADGTITSDDELKRVWLRGHDLWDLDLSDEHVTKMTRDDLWRIGVERLGWPQQMPDDADKAAIHRRLLEAKYEGVGDFPELDELERLQDLGYVE